MMIRDFYGDGVDFWDVWVKILGGGRKISGGGNFMVVGGGMKKVVGGDHLQTTRRSSWLVSVMEASTDAALEMRVE
ncbi:hypothetical protein LIER_43531 [Lithospermum erythrorhizon]|uniref:Uncharacterized protein n=1 Tax=Lithospermum erythrorhizon TaxID=34254 RepID=A0AAV3Q9B2_LITER